MLWRHRIRCNRYLAVVVDRRVQRIGVAHRAAEAVSGVASQRQRAFARAHRLRTVERLHLSKREGDATDHHVLNAVGCCDRERRAARTLARVAGRSQAAFIYRRVRPFRIRRLDARAIVRAVDRDRQRRRFLVPVRVPHRVREAEFQMVVRGQRLDRGPGIVEREAVCTGRRIQDQRAVLTERGNASRIGSVVPADERLVRIGICRVVVEHVPADGRKAVFHQHRRRVIRSRRQVIDDIDDNRGRTGTAVFVGHADGKVVERAVGAAAARVREVVLQGVAVAHRAAEFVAGVAGQYKNACVCVDRHGVRRGVQQLRHAQRDSRDVVTHLHDRNAVLRVDGERSRLSQRRRIRRAAVRQVLFVDGLVARRAADAENRHAVVRTGDRDLEGRRARVSVSVPHRVAERLDQRLAFRKTLHRVQTVVELVAPGAVRILRDGPVLPRFVAPCKERFRCVRAAQIICEHVAIDRARRILGDRRRVVHRQRHVVVDDDRRDDLGARRIGAVGHRDPECILLGACAVGDRRVEFIAPGPVLPAVRRVEREDAVARVDRGAARSRVERDDEVLIHPARPVLHFGERDRVAVDVGYGE